MKKRIFLLLYTLCVYWTSVIGVHLAEDRRIPSLRSSGTKLRIHDQSYSSNSKRRKGKVLLTKMWLF